MYTSYDFGVDFDIALRDGETGQVVAALNEIAAWATQTAEAICTNRYEPAVPAGHEERIVLRSAIDLIEVNRGYRLVRGEPLARLRFHLK